MESYWKRVGVGMPYVSPTRKPPVPTSFRNARSSFHPRPPTRRSPRRSPPRFSPRSSYLGILKQKNITNGRRPYNTPTRRIRVSPRREFLPPPESRTKSANYLYTTRPI